MGLGVLDQRMQYFWPVPLIADDLWRPVSLQLLRVKRFISSDVDDTDRPGEDSHSWG